MSAYRPGFTVAFSVTSYSLKDKDAAAAEKNGTVPSWTCND